MRSLFQAGLLAGVSLISQAAWAQAVELQAADTPNRGIEDIVVTAQKREQRLQDVPVAVTAITSEQISEMRIQDVTDLRSMVPSMNVRQNPSGESPIIVMRGALAAGGQNPTVDQSVSLYIDGVYLGGTSGTATFDVSDVERVEVIRGPAGTLFGTNATAGAINFITAGPKGVWAARQELSYGRFNSFRSKTRIDLPEWNGLSVSASYLHNYRGSNVRNANIYTWNVGGVSLGGPTSLTSARKLGTSKTDAFNIAVRYEPFAGLRFDYKFDRAEQSSPGPATNVLGFASSFGSAARDILAAQMFFGGPTLDQYVDRERDTTVYNGFSTPQTQKFDTHFASIQYEANEHLTIKNIASWRNWNRGFRLNQLDGAGSIFLPDSSGNLQPFGILTFQNGEQRNQFSNETQFIVDTDPVDLTAGLFYYTRHTQPGTFATRIYSFQSFPNFTIPGTFSPSQLQTSFRTRQIAGYAQGTAHLTTKLDLTGGIRYTQDSKQIFDGTIAPGRTFDYNRGKFTWLGNVSYKPNDDIMIYAKYTTGFVAGGITIATANVTDPGTGLPFVGAVAVPYTEETAKSIEAGVKADFFDRRLRANIAVFHVEYGGQQFQQSVQLQVPVPSGATVPVTAFATTNVGKSRNFGVEYELTAVPVEGFTLSANGAYNDFKFIDAAASLGTPTGRPKFTANLGAEYEIPVGGDMRFSIRGDGEYRSSQALYGFDINEDPLLFPENAGLTSRLYQKSLWRLHARATLKDIPIGPTTARLSVWGRNLTNQTPVNTASDLGTVISGTFDDPVSYGVDLVVAF